MEGAEKKEGDSPKKDAKEKSPSLFKAMLRCFGPRYALLGIFTFFEECILRIYQPLFMGKDSHVTLNKLIIDMYRLWWLGKIVFLYSLMIP